jgi:hypothetical protein
MKYLIIFVCITFAGVSYGMGETSTDCQMMNETRGGNVKTQPVNQPSGQSSAVRR